MDWHLPNPRTGHYYKRPFAKTTQADGDAIVSLGGMTWREASESELLLSPESRVVIDRFVAEGYGDELIKERVMDEYLCQTDGCSLAQAFEVMEPESGRIKIVCRDCANELHEVHGWRILRYL